MYNIRKNKLIPLMMLGVLSITAYEAQEYKQKRISNAMNQVMVVMHTSKSLKQVDERLTKLDIEHNIDGTTIYVSKSGEKREFKVVGLKEEQD